MVISEKNIKVTFSEKINDEKNKYTNNLLTIKAYNNQKPILSIDNHIRNISTTNLKKMAEFLNKSAIEIEKDKDLLNE